MNPGWAKGLKRGEIEKAVAEYLGMSVSQMQKMRSLGMLHGHWPVDDNGREMQGVDVEARKNKVALARAG
jgi:hypothetical protein